MNNHRPMINQQSNQQGKPIKAFISHEELQKIKPLNSVHEQHLLTEMLEKKGFKVIQKGRLRKELVGKVVQHEDLERGGAVFIQYPDRMSGRTTRQLENCVGGSLFFWGNACIDYPVQLASKLGRDDIQVYSVGDLGSMERWMSVDVHGVEVDHYAQGKLGEREMETLEYLKSRVGYKMP